YYLPDTGEVADYVTQLAIGDVEGQALGGNPVAAPWWLGATEAKAAIWPWLIGGLLGAGAIAALASDDDDKPTTDTTADKPDLTPNNDGSITVKPGNDNTKVDVKYIDEDGVEHTSTITKGKDGNWTSTDPNLIVDPKTGTITIPADKVKDGSEVTAKGTDDKGNEATRITTAGNNPTTPEADTTADKPGLTPNDDGSITVKPGPDNTKVVVKYTDEDGNPKEATLTKDKDGNWSTDNPDLVKNQDGTFAIPADKVKDGSDVNAKGTDDKGNMADADKAIAGNNPASEPEQPTDTKIPGDSNNDGKVDGDDDSNNEVKLPNDKTVPRNTDGAPNIVFGEDTNQDGTLNKTEIGDDQSTPVYVTIPDNTEEGDKVIVTINGKDQEIPVTAEMLKDGFTTVDVPTTDLSEIKVTAKVTSPDGSQSSNEATATAKVDTTADTPEVLANDDGSVTITPKGDNVKVEVKYTDEDGKEHTATITKGEDGKWTSNDPALTTDPESGKTTIPPKQVEFNTPVIATSTDDNGNTATKTVTAKDDADKPTLADDNGSITVTPGEDNTEVVVKFTDENGEPQKVVVKYDSQSEKWAPEPEDDDRVIISGSGKDATFTIPAELIEDGSKVGATGINNHNTPAEAEPASVGNNPDITADEPKLTPNNDGSVTVKPGPDNTKVEVTYIDADDSQKEVTLTKDKDGNWSTDNPDLVKNQDGTFTIPADKVKDGSDVNARGTDDKDNTADADKAVAVDNIPGDSNYNGKIDGDDDSGKEITLPNGQKVPVNTDGAPNIIFGEDANDDGKLNNKELGSKDPADKTLVYITIPDNTEAGDTVHVKVTTPDGKTDEKDVVLTQEDIAKGYIEESVPVAKDQDGDITVTAKVTDPAGNTSSEGKKTVSVDTKIPGDTNGDGKVDDNDDSGKEVELPNGQKVPANENGAPNIVFGEDGNLDGKLNKQELGSKDGEETTPVYITIPDKTEVGDTIKVTITTPEGTETKEIPVTAEMLKDGFTTVDVPVKQDGEIKVTAKVEDPAGNTSAEGSSAVTVDTSVVPVVPPSTPEKTTTPTVEVSNKDTDGNGADDKTTISGKTDPNADVTVTLPDGSTQTTKADKDGNYSVDVPVLTQDDKVGVVAKAPDKTPSDEGTGTVPAVHTEPTPTEPEPTEPTPEPASVDNKDGKGVQTTTPKNEGEELVTTVKLTNENGNPSLSFAQPNGTKPGELGKDDFDKSEFSNGVTQNPDGTLNVPAGVKEFTITTPVKADETTEGPETGKLTVGGVEGNEVTVNDTSNDPAVPPTPPVDNPDVVAEGNGGVHVIPGPDNTELKVTFIDEDEKSQEVTIVKGADDTWTLKEGTIKPAGVTVKPDGIVLIDPEAVKDKSEVMAEGTNGNPDAAEPGMDTDTTTDDNVPANVNPDGGKGVVTTPDTTDEGTNFVTTVKLTNNNGNKNLPFELPNGTGEGQLGADDFDKSTFSKGVTLNEDGTLNVEKGIKEFTITTPVKVDNVTEGVEKGKFNVGGIDGNEVTVKDTSTDPVNKLTKPNPVANDDGSVTVTPVDPDTDKLTVDYTDEKGQRHLATATKHVDENPDGSKSTYWTVDDNGVTVDANTGEVTIPADRVEDKSKVTAIAHDTTEKRADSDPAMTEAKDDPVPPQITLAVADNFSDEYNGAAIGTEGKEAKELLNGLGIDKFEGTVGSDGLVVDSSTIESKQAIDSLADGLTNDATPTVKFTLDHPLHSVYTIKFYRSQIVGGNEFDRQEITAKDNGDNTYTHQSAELPETSGTQYRYTAEVTDAKGNVVATKSQDIYLDTIVESMEVTDIVSNDKTGAVTSMTLNAVDRSEVGATIKISYPDLAGTTQTVNAVDNGNGTYTVNFGDVPFNRYNTSGMTVEVIDAAGNISSTKVMMLRNLFATMNEEQGPDPANARTFNVGLITDVGFKQKSTADGFKFTEGNDHLVVGVDEYKGKAGVNGNYASMVGSGALNVNTGAGDDHIQLRGNLQSWREGKLETGDGNDKLTFDTAEVATGGFYNIDMGNGNDTILINGAINLQATIKAILGEGDDAVIARSNLDGSNSSSYDFGEGNNRLEVGGYVTKQQTFTFGSGNDVVFVKGAFDHSTANLGDGNNLFSVGGRVYHADITSGAGNDIFVAGTVTGTSAEKTSIDLGAGNDTFTTKLLGAGFGTVTLGEGNDIANIDKADGGYLNTNDGDDKVTIGDLTKTAVDLGAGNDTITLKAVLSGAASIEGGEGTDTVVLQGVGEKQTYDMGYFKNVEYFDLTATGRQDLNIKLKDLQANGDTIKKIYIKGTSEDTVDLGDNNGFNDTTANLEDISNGIAGGNKGTWTKAKTEVVDGTAYDVYAYSSQNHGVSDELVYIQQGVQVL
ncbi:hypothetical protein, partial [Moraxella marmotae]|uniref:hypothetical protein n=1 Tax=Moraxella marmotae TaxID=3344520 RepID=UPI0035F33284